MRTVLFQGQEQELAGLCRRFGINRRTVVSRLERGVPVDAAVTLPARHYPELSKKGPPPVDIPEIVPQATRRDPVIQDAIDLLVDTRGILENLEPTPRRSRVLAGVRHWLLGVGWRG